MIAKAMKKMGHKNMDMTWRACKKKIRNEGPHDKVGKQLLSQMGMEVVVGIHAWWCLSSDKCQSGMNINHNLYIALRGAEIKGSIGIIPTRLIHNVFVFPFFCQQWMCTCWTIYD